MEEKDVVTDNSKTEEVADALETTDAADGEASESGEELKARLAKAEELANNYKIRAEKAERKAKESKAPAEEAKASSDISIKDAIALMKANVADEDMDEVVKYAKYMGITVGEALNTTAIKATLSEKTEKRNSANATSVGTGRRSTGKVSDETLLDKAAKGELPDSDEDMTRLVRLQMGIKS